MENFKNNSDSKSFPPKNVESDVRPIAVTNTMAKIVKKFVSILMIFVILIQTLTSLDVHNAMRYDV